MAVAAHRCTRNPASRARPFLLRSTVAAVLAFTGLSSQATPVTGCALGYYLPQPGSACVISPPGTYSLLNATAPTPAQVGTYIPFSGATSAAAALPAPVGTYVATTGASAPVAAPAGFYVPTIGASAATAASAGHYVPTIGASAQTVAPAGTYVGNIGASAPTLAPPGRYIPNTGATSVAAALPAPVGTYIPTSGASSAAAALPAPVGGYVATAGASTYSLAPVGSYVATTGASTATAAPVGFFVASVGASTAMAAPAGAYVPTTGASAATPAGIGHFVAGTGASSQTAAPLGHYVATTGASAPTAAPAGFYVATTGASAATQAQRGFYVPTAGASAATAAAAGRFVGTAGAVADQLCPTGTNAYGAAPACRIVADNVAAGPDVVGPSFASSLGAPGVVDLGATQPGPVQAFTVRNDSHDLGATNDLTSLTLLSYSLDGAQAGHFTLTGFSAGMVLGEGQSASFQLLADAGLQGAYSVTLHLLSDQNADFGQAGRHFSYTFTGTAPVPEPATWLTLLAGLGVLAGWRRRRGQPA